ncbi:low-density lipoprotein receptor class A domain-containing protein 4-like isoform X2 [Lineus longissimus]|uniref:low-density lipoprotein receptor class A domain-containing protein 4-like isoform X2 n=1 Tax=Lineus longissimus TaxID=88925 RepID=UPI00315D8A63
MLLCFSLFVALLYDTVLANVCSYTYKTSPRNISASSTNTGHDKCKYYIQTSRNYYIVLNFTNIYGFWPGHQDTKQNTNKCLPNLVIKEITPDGKEKEMAVICEKNHNYNPPKVFQSRTQLVQLTYSWVPGERSGFHLEYFEEECAFRCDDYSCLPLASLPVVCDGFLDCPDNSDEKDCNALSTTDPSRTSESSNINLNLGASATGDYIQTIVIVIAVLFTLCVIICVVCYYCALSRPSWGDHRQRLSDHLSTSSEHNQLRTNTPPLPRHSEVVYVPPHNRSYRDLHTEGRTRPHPFQHSMTEPVDLPPHIPISGDGEEGYSRSQQLLQCDTSDEVERGCIRSPPNVTISQFDSKWRESSSYLTPSHNLLEKHNSKFPVIRDGNGSPMSMKCYSSSNNNNPNKPNSRTHRTSPQIVGHSRHSSGSSANSSNSERPPEYSEVIANMDSFGGNTTTGGGV